MIIPVRALDNPLITSVVTVKTPLIKAVPALTTVPAIFPGIVNNAPATLPTDDSVPVTILPIAPSVPVTVSAIHPKGLRKKLLLIFPPLPLSVSGPLFFLRIIRTIFSIRALVPAKLSFINLCMLEAVEEILVVIGNRALSLVFICTVAAFAISEET